MTAPSAEPVLASSPPKPVARWEDFVDIFYAPAAVFKRRENQSPWPPILIVTALTFLVTFGTFNALQPLIDIEVQRGIARGVQQSGQHLTPDQAASAQRIFDLTFRFGAILTPIGMLATALAVWLAGKVVGSRQTYSAAMVVVAYTFLFLTVEALVNGVQGLVMDASTLPSIYALQIGPARFLDPTKTSPVLFAVLTRLNVFAIWRTVLLAIGTRVTGKISWPSAAFVAVAVWALATIWQMRNIISVYG